MRERCRQLVTVLATCSGYACRTHHLCPFKALTIGGAVPLYGDRVRCDRSPGSVACYFVYKYRRRVAVCLRTAEGDEL